MKTISLEEAYNLIDNATAVMVDDGPLSYPALASLNGQPENEWLYLGWVGPNGDQHRLKFIEEEQEIKFDGSSIYMLDDEDDEFKITLLCIQKA